MDELPFDSPIEYLEGNGSQYINCDVINTINTEFYIDFKLSNYSGDHGIIGQTGKFGFGYINNIWRILDTDQFQTLKNADTDRHIVYTKQGNYYIDSVLLVGNRFNRIVAGTSTMRVFSSNGSNPSPMRLYSCKIYEGTVLVRDYIPVRVGQVGYLYDKVSGELFGNAGSGSFTLGQDISFNVNRNVVKGFRRRLLSIYPNELQNYLCFEALEDTTFTLTIPSGVPVYYLSYIEYSVDNGKSWVHTDNINSTQVDIVTPLVEQGNKVYWKGLGVRMSNGNGESGNGCRFSSDGKFDVSGVLTSLLTGTDEEIASINNNTFVSLFKSSKVVNAKDLILPKYCKSFSYAYTFKNCTNLVSAPNLPALVAPNRCYLNMFYGCSSLTEAPIIAATSADFAAFQNFMSNCTSLVTAPEINVDTIKSTQCFMNCFQGCTSLKNPPSVLPAKVGKAYCYSSMFNGCTNLEKTPIIKLESLDGDDNCSSMFRDTKITTCELKPEILVGGCYNSMFYNSKLSYIKMLATDVSASNCLLNWMYRVPNVATSVFVKHIDATWTTTGNNGVLSNWTIIYYDPALDKYYTDQTRSQECDDHGNPI